MGRETYSSLKAVWGARRVAARFVYREPIEVIRQDCPGCGRGLPVGEMGEDWVVACGGCGERVRLPGHVVAAVERARMMDGADEGWDWGDWRRRHPAKQTGEAEGIEWNIVLGTAGIITIIVILVWLLPSVVGRG